MASLEPRQPKRNARPEKRCIHCLQPITAKSEDHVFPASWYPDTTPGTVQRWKVPSCLACNNRLGEIEKDLLIRLGLCVDPANAKASGISRKVLRTLGVGGAGATEQEREIRRKAKEQIKREMIPYTDVKGKPGIFPGFGPRSDFTDEEQFAVLVPHEALRAVAEKVTRGCEYKLANRYVDPPYGMRTFFVEQTPEIDALFARATRSDLGPGFRIARLAAEADDPETVLYQGVIWGSFTFQTAIDLDSAFKE